MLCTWRPPSRHMAGPSTIWIMVAVTGAHGTDAVIRRAARIAARTKADLHAVYVAASESTHGGSVDDLDHGGGHRRARYRRCDPPGRSHRGADQGGSACCVRGGLRVDTWRVRRRP